MTKIEITEDRPMVYPAHDGVLIVVSVAGPVEKVYTLTVGGERRLSDTSEDYVRYVARAEAAARNERYAANLVATGPGTVTATGAAKLDARFGPRWRESASVQIASPLAEGERQSSGLVGGGAAANRMSEAVRERLRVAVKWTPEGQPVVIHRCGRTNVRMLKAMARRGWLELDNKVRPSYGTVTDAGRRALAAELARTGGAR